MTPILVIFSLAVGGVRGLCYFPAAFQGEYVSQAVVSSSSPSAPHSSISYSSISVLYDSIPVWGYCHRRLGKNVILMDDTGGLTCYRCFNLALRSSNVLQIHTDGLEKCYTTEEAAVATCVTDVHPGPAAGGATEIMLYRTKGFLGEPAVSPTYCPFNGAYTFTYSVNDGTEKSLECASAVSEISDCPYGFGFNLRFKQCSFGNMDLSFHCLGDWDAPGRDTGERYVTLMDTAVSSHGADGASMVVGTEEHSGGTRPRYRCAIYREDPATGRIHMALSSDSTCVSHLDSADRGYETLVLHPKPEPAWPAHVEEQGATCTFPGWAQGEWEHLHFAGDLVTYKDHRNFKTYTGKCVPHAHATEADARYAGERFMVYTRTQCGDEVYKCLWIKERGLNTLEVQLGLYTSDTHNASLCGEENFLERTWTTQGRLDIAENAPYRFTGEYTGVIPDTEGFCAKLYSDCNNPEIMFYNIFNCFNRTEVYEEREYRCLGQWEESGVVYTYTERRDMAGYECFVGVTTERGEIYLQEAGNNCERGQEPLRYGMRLSRVAECYYHRPYSPKFRWRDTTTAVAPSGASAEEEEKGASGAGGRAVTDAGHRTLAATAVLLLVTMLR